MNRGVTRRFETTRDTVQDFVNEGNARHLADEVLVNFDSRWMLVKGKDILSQREQFEAYQNANNERCHRAPSREGYIFGRALLPLQLPLKLSGSRMGFSVRKLNLADTCCNDRRGFFVTVLTVLTVITLLTFLTSVAPFALNGICQVDTSIIEA